jgi:hypothetical protein
MKSSPVPRLGPAARAPSWAWQAQTISPASAALPDRRGSQPALLAVKEHIEQSPRTETVRRQRLIFPPPPGHALQCKIDINEGSAAGFQELVTHFLTIARQTGGPLAELIGAIDGGIYSQNTDLCFKAVPSKKDSPNLGSTRIQVFYENKWQELLGLGAEDWEWIESDDPIRITIEVGLNARQLAAEALPERSLMDELYILTHEFGLHVAKDWEYIRQIRRNETEENLAPSLRSMYGVLSEFTEHRGLVQRTNQGFEALLRRVGQFVAQQEQLSKPGYSQRDFQRAHQADLIAHRLLPLEEEYTDLVQALWKDLEQFKKLSTPLPPSLPGKIAARIDQAVKLNEKIQVATLREMETLQKEQSFSWKDMHQFLATSVLQVRRQENAWLKEQAELLKK